MTIEDDVSVGGTFDFTGHSERAKGRYEVVRDTYAECAEAVHKILSDALRARGIKIHSIESRAKTAASFLEKCAREDSEDTSRPKYPDPLSGIKDMAGVRVITFFLETVQQVRGVIFDEFVVRDESDRGALLGDKEMGYASLHFEIEFKPARLALPEYRRFDGLLAEIQLRTILQHTWAEIEHDIQYKATSSLPDEVRKRFASLAGLIAIGDREFQAIADSDREIQQRDRESLAAGRLNDIELTAASLKLFLDKRLVPDGRITDVGYDAALGNLRALGFTSIEQLANCLENYDSELISRTLTGGRQGQLTRLDQILLAALAEQYIERKRLTGDDANSARLKLERLKRRRIPVGTYQLPAAGLTPG